MDVTSESSSPSRSGLQITGSSPRVGGGGGSSGSGSLNTSALLKMPTIEEREGEWDMKEEIERKEKEYLKRLAALEQDVDNLRRQKDE